MAVNPTISIIYTKNGGGNQGGTQQPDFSKKQKATSSVEHFKKTKPTNKFMIGKALGLKTIAGGGLYVAVTQTVGKTVNTVTRIDEAMTGNKVNNFNIRQLTSAIQRPISFAKKAIWEYGIIEPMIVNRQNEALMYNRVLTGQMIYGEGKQRGIF